MFGANVSHQVLFPAVLGRTVVTVELRRNADALVTDVPKQVGLAQIVAAAHVAVVALVGVVNAGAVCAGFGVSDKEAVRVVGTEKKRKSQAIFRLVIRINDAYPFTTTSNAI